MADIRKLRAKLRPLIRGAGGATVLVAGLAASCTEGTVSGNLVAPDVQQVDSAADDDATSGNLLAPDISTVDAGDAGSTDTGATGPDAKDPDAKDAGTKDSGTPDPDTFSSGNLLPPDLDTVTTEPDTSGASDTSGDATTDTGDGFVVGNLLPPEPDVLDAAAADAGQDQ